MPRKGWLAHYRELFGIWRRKNLHDGEDAIQDAVVKMLENGLGGVDDPRAYLSRSTANGLIDRHRRRTLLEFRPWDDLDEDEHPSVEDGQASIFTTELLDALMVALQELPLACQKVYIRHRIEGWTHAEIARDLGVSRSMVEKHMNRALLHIHERLQKYSPY